MDAVKKEFAANNFHHAFTIVDKEFPLDSDAEIALKVTTSATYLSLSNELKSEVKTVVRKQLKIWDSQIESYFG